MFDGKSLRNQITEQERQRNDTTATKPAPQIQALRLTTVRVIKCLYYMYVCMYVLLLHPSNGLFSRTTWVSWY